MIVAHNSPNNFKLGPALGSEEYGLLGLSSMMASALALARHTTLTWLIRRQVGSGPCPSSSFSPFSFPFRVHLHPFYLHCILSRPQQRQAVPVSSTPFLAAPCRSLPFLLEVRSPLIGNKAAEWGASSFDELAVGACCWAWSVLAFAITLACP